MIMLGASIRKLLLRRSLAGLLIAGLVVLQPRGALADFVDGNKLYKYCSDPSSIEHEVCYGYIESIADVMYNEPVFGYKICISQNVAFSQLRDVVVQYMISHPERRHFGAASMVARALSQAFPCQ